MRTVDRSRLAGLMERERALFRERTPRSAALAEDAKASLLFGVPMNWMTRWPGDYPVFVDHAEGARFTDVDGNGYVDLCLGDTGGMAGHAPKIAVDAIWEQAAKGITLMLPTEDAAWVGRELARRFGLPYWNFALTATDANRFAIRWARQVTGRPKVLFHNWCYHGSVDESFATLTDDGEVVAREGNIGKPVPLDDTTRVVEINDLEGLERELATGDVAVCLFEPALTNIGIVLPEPGYHEAVRELCIRYGTLLLIDETHTISAGPGGCTRAWGLDPDIVTIGKTLGAGIPIGRVRVLRGAHRTGARPHRLEERRRRRGRRHPRRQRALARRDAGNARRGHDRRGLHADDRARRAVRGRGAGRHHDARAAVARRSAGLPRRVPVPARRRPTGAEAAAGQDEEVDPFIHLYLLNRGLLMTPFHNMALMSPATTADDVDRHTEVFAAMADELIGDR